MLEGTVFEGGGLVGADHGIEAGYLQGIEAGTGEQIEIGFEVKNEVETWELCPDLEQKRGLVTAQDDSPQAGSISET